MSSNKPMARYKSISVIIFIMFGVSSCEILNSFLEHSEDVGLFSSDKVSLMGCIYAFLWIGGFIMIQASFPSSIIGQILRAGGFLCWACFFAAMFYTIHFYAKNTKSLPIRENGFEDDFKIYELLAKNHIKVYMEYDVQRGMHRVRFRQEDEKEVRDLLGNRIIN